MPRPSTASVKPDTKPPAKNPNETVKKEGFSQKQRTYLPDIHRSLPSSLDAEKGVLGSILLDPQRVIDFCIERGITHEYFHLPAHGLVYQASREMHDASKPVDLISLTQYLEDYQRLEEAGGAGAISELFTFVPTAANAEYYVDILREKHLLRRIISTCGEFTARAYEEQGEVSQLLDQVEQRILSINDERLGQVAPDMKALTVQALMQIEKVFTSRGQISGLATGFSGIDELTDGLHNGEMVVVAARPSMGKTALAMNIAEHVAMEARKGVAVFSLEMSTQQLVQRMLCSRARVDLKKVRKQMAPKHTMRSLVDATQELSECKMFIDDTPSLEILDLRARARRLKSRYGVDLIVIDYLQLLRSGSRRGQDNRQVEVAEISAGIKALAKELDVPILALAQLNRNPEIRSGGGKGRPRLSDLRESGSIEQDADVVALLWREDYYADDEESKKEHEGLAELVVAKQRNGPTGDIPLTFIKEFTRFEDRAAARTESA
jgi:replicative DNA helicase